MLRHYADIETHNQARRLAYHEAGHAVAACLLGGVVKYSMIADGTNWLPQTLWDWRPIDQAEQLHTRAVVSIACFQSEHINLGRLDSSVLDRAADDLAQARELAWEMLPSPRPEIEQWNDKDCFRRLRQEGKRTLATPENELAVHLVAQELYLNDEITGELLELRVRRARTNYTDTQLVDAREFTEVYERNR